MASVLRPSSKTREQARPIPGLAEALPMVTDYFLPVLRLNSKVPPLGKLGVKRQQEREEGKGEAERCRLGGGLGAAGPDGECLPFLNLCPHSRDLPPTRKGKLKASPSDHVSMAQGLGGLEAEPPGEGWGRWVAMWQYSSSEDRKAAVSCFRCWGPWERLSWQEEATGSAGFMWLGEIACRPRDAQKPAREPVSQGLTQRSADLLRRWCLPPLHSPTFLAGGGWWEAAGTSPLGSRSQASDFKAAWLVVKSRQEPVPVL